MKHLYRGIWAALVLSLAIRIAAEVVEPALPMILLLFFFLSMFTYLLHR